MTEQDVWDFIDWHDWKKGYTPRHKARDDAEFDRLVAFISEVGYLAPRYNTTVPMLVVGDYDYWTLGDQLAPITSIYRAKVSGRYHTPPPPDYVPPF